MVISVNNMPMLTGSDALSSLTLTPQLVGSLATTATSIGRLDARISASLVAAPWRLRSAWTGYSRALQLQGIEIDEIDVFSWGCDLPLPDRPRRSTAIGEFDEFPGWWKTLHAPPATNWRDRLPFSPVQPADAGTWPALLRAVDILRQAARQDRTIGAWLRLPELLKGFGATKTPLPCLVDGAKAFRLRATPTHDDWRAILRALGKAAEIGLERLQTMEVHHRRAAATIVAERRPSALPRLMALAAFQPLLSPQSVAVQLDLSLPGAGKLLSRAAELGMLVEVSGRRAWRRYLVPDLAVTFGFMRAPQGRPRKPPAASLLDRDISDIFSAFDEEMRLLDIKLGGLGIASHDEELG